MSKLQDLIRELCPNGVEYKKIGEIANDLFLVSLLQVISLSDIKDGISVSSDDNRIVN